MAEWKVSFRDVLVMGTNKTGIKEIKQRAKAHAGSSEYHYGMFVEESVIELLERSEELSVKRTTPQMDIGFGADIQLSYKKNDKNYSFFMDITSGNKECSYFSLKDGIQSDVHNAFVYEMGGVKVKFGIKKRHGNSFFYEKPVVVFKVSGLTTDTTISQSDINNVSSILMTLNDMMMDMGYGARASQLVYPNKSLYKKEYLEYLKTMNGGN